MASDRLYRLVKMSMVESRIRKFFKRKRKKEPAPSILLTKLLKPRKGVELKLSQEERKEFVALIKEMYRTRKLIERYRIKYNRRPRFFYKKIFGFPPRNGQSVKILWGKFNIHFAFKKNDLIYFWKKVGWGPGSGGFYPVGDRDIKIKDLRGLISFGREENNLVETNHIIRHESVHAFEDFVKKRKHPQDSKAFLFFTIKAELNAYLHNFKYYKSRHRRKINEWAIYGYGDNLRQLVEEYFTFDETKKRIANLKIKIKKCKKKREKKQLKIKLNSLKKRLEVKKKKRREIIRIQIKTLNQVRKALEVMPVEVLQRVICETRYPLLYKKIPEAVKVYLKIKSQWYNNHG